MRETNIMVNDIVVLEPLQVGVPPEEEEEDFVFEGINDFEYDVKFLEDEDNLGVLYMNFIDDFFVISFNHVIIKWHITPLENEENVFGIKFNNNMLLYYDDIEGIHDRYDIDDLYDILRENIGDILVERIWMNCDEENLKDNIVSRKLHININLVDVDETLTFTLHNDTQNVRTLYAYENDAEVLTHNV